MLLTCNYYVAPKMQVKVISHLKCVTMFKTLWCRTSIQGRVYTYMVQRSINLKYTCIYTVRISHTHNRTSTLQQSYSRLFQDGVARVYKWRIVSRGVWGDAPPENHVKSLHMPQCFKHNNELKRLKFLPETVTCTLEITPVSKQLGFSEETRHFVSFLETVCHTLSVVLLIQVK